MLGREGREKRFFKYADCLFSRQTASFSTPPNLPLSFPLMPSKGLPSPPSSHSTSAKIGGNSRGIHGLLHIHLFLFYPYARGRFWGIGYSLKNWIEFFNFSGSRGMKRVIFFHLTPAAPAFSAESSCLLTLRSPSYFASSHLFNGPLRAARAFFHSSG